MNITQYCFSYSSVDRHLGSLQFLAIMNNAAINTCTSVHKSSSCFTSLSTFGVVILFTGRYKMISSDGFNLCFPDGQ